MKILKMVSLAVTIVVGLAAIVYYGQNIFGRSGKEAPVVSYPSLTLELAHKSEDAKFSTIFDVLDSGRIIKYAYSVKNTSSYPLKRLRARSIIDNSVTDTLSLISSEAQSFVITLAPGEEINGTGSYYPPGSNWKKLGDYYLHVRVDFADPYGKEFMYKETQFMAFRNVEIKNSKEFFDFGMGLQSSSVEQLPTGNRE